MASSVVSHVLGGGGELGIALDHLGNNLLQHVLQNILREGVKFHLVHGVEEIFLSCHLPSRPDQML